MTMLFDLDILCETELFDHDDKSEKIPIHMLKPEPNPDAPRRTKDFPGGTGGDSCWGCGHDFKQSETPELTKDPSGRELCPDCYWEVNDMNESIGVYDCPDCGSSLDKDGTCPGCGEKQVSADQVYDAIRHGDQKIKEAAEQFLSILNEENFNLDSHIQQTLKNTPPEQQIDHADVVNAVMAGLPSHMLTPENKKSVELKVGNFIEQQKHQFGAGGKPMHQPVATFSGKDVFKEDINIVSQQILLEWMPGKEHLIHFEELSKRQHDLRAYGQPGNGIKLDAQTKENARDHLVRLIKLHDGQVKKHTTVTGGEHSTTHVFIPHEVNDVNPEYYNGTHLNVNFIRGKHDEHGFLNIKMSRGMQKRRGDIS